MDLIRVFLLVVGILGIYLPLSDAKVCRGTNNGLTHQGDAQHRYETLKQLYSNCTVVDGNIEIVFLNGQDDYDLSYLQDIKEVTGYILIVSVYASSIPLRNLRIIRGRTLFPQNDQERRTYSLYIANNYKRNSKTVGLKQLGFTSLHEILAGDVMLSANNLLCHDNTIDWADILVGEHAQVFSNIQQQRECLPCHDTCKDDSGVAHCWGDGEDMCQHLTLVTCAKQCEGRCFGPRPSQCCNAQCAGGCTGPSPQECWACKNFNNEGVCVPFCPPLEIYNDREFKNVKNPDAKLTYGTLCVDECPSYLVQESGACVKECGAGKIAVNNTCTPCDGTCPKTCKGVEDNQFLEATDLERFKGCTVINGNLVILDTSIGGDARFNIPPIHPSNLSVFEDVQEIYGHVNIQGKHQELTSAHFLRNLKYIYGRQLGVAGSSLQIVATSFQSIGLISLQKVMNGIILIVENPDLCYTSHTDFTKFVSSPSQNVIVRKNREQDKCRSNGFVCHPQCSTEGCWGPGPIQCLSCLNFKLGDECIEYCNRSRGLYSIDNHTCYNCDPECRHTCYGHGNQNCDDCKHVKDGPFCVPMCPISKYADDQNVCQTCHENCVNGCEGPINNIGSNGCNSCDHALVDTNYKIEQCLPADTINCPTGYFRSFMRNENNTMSGKQVCEKCHHLCKRCTGPGSHYCEECRWYKEGPVCVKTCSADFYPANHKLECLRCDPECKGCRGPTASDCLACTTYKVYIDDMEEETNSLETPKFNCTAKCPVDFPEVDARDKTTGTEFICIPEALARASKGAERQPVMIGTAVACVVFVAGVILAIVYGCRQRARAKENTMKLAARFSGLEEGEPLTPTNASPDMAKLRLIKECEVRKGNIIGSGAFGTVYKGMWVPENENVKIPVAIKVLQESTSPSQNKELLEEARVMASVDHPHCVRVLAICMTAQMMLITQLMPLGCLLDYVRKHRSNIGSKVLLNWCTQIARGMTYLEDKGVVHRDLAARNVLVQSAAVVKITDFGLAKLLDFNEDEYRSSGGKMPIKWLALECIQHRIFTHKSDVWSYGVTVWELFTYGQRPYESVRARDVPDLLEKGERLPQPSICTIDVYMIMIKCWMLDAESRPHFRELAEEFSKMARDPGRYLVIQGDKLMRLPSHNINTEDLLRTLSVAGEGPEQIMDAEDYLQPTVTTTVEPQHMNGTVEKMRDTTDYDNDRGSASASRPRDPNECTNYPRHNKKYSPDVPLSRKQDGKTSRESISSRYSPDPCKTLDDQKEGETLPDSVAPPLPGSVPPEEEDALDGRLRNGKQPLPVIDEDDYLTPKSSQPAPYMDIIDSKGNYTDYTDPLHQTDYLEPEVPSSVDNPEYFQSMSDTDTVAIDGLKSQKDAARITRTPDQDSNYYNDRHHKKQMSLNGSMTESVI